MRSGNRNQAVLYNNTLELVYHDGDPPTLDIVGDQYC